MIELFPIPNLETFQEGAGVYAIEVRENLENIKEAFSRKDLETLYANGIIPGAFSDGDKSIVFFYSPPVVFYPVRYPIRRMSLSQIEGTLMDLEYIKLISKSEDLSERTLIFSPLGIEAKQSYYEEDAKWFLDYLKEKIPDLLDALLTYNVNLGNYRLSDERLYTWEGIFEYDESKGFYAKLAFVDLHSTGREEELFIYELRYDKGEPKKIEFYKANLIERAFEKELKAYLREEKEFEEISDGWVDDRLREIKIVYISRKVSNTRRLLKKAFYRKNYRNKLYTAPPLDYIVEIERKKSPENYLLDIKKGRILRLPIPPKRIPASLIHKLVRQG